MVRDKTVNFSFCILLLGFSVSPAFLVGCTGVSRLDAEDVDVSVCVSTSSYEDQCDKEPQHQAEPEDTVPQE